MISIPPRGLGRPERAVTFPRSHRVDTEGKSSGCLHPDPECPPVPTVLFLPSQTQPGGGARLQSPETPCCSPAGLALASARLCRGTDRRPGDTAGAAGHLQGRGSAPQGFPSALSKAHASLAEPPGWGAQAGIPNSSKLPADFNWRFCPRQEYSARPVAF